VSAGQCTARYGGFDRCERTVGHVGMHQARNGVLRWGGRYRPSDLSGKPGVVKDAAKDQAARKRRPKGPRCSICCHPGELKNGRCADPIACAERQPYLFGAEDLEPQPAGRNDPT
jgi:hypothetical protein